MALSDDDTNLLRKDENADGVKYAITYCSEGRMLIPTL
jgi:hypothetical protein